MARSWVDEIDAESAARGLSPEAVELLDLDNEAIAEIYANIEENVSEVRDLLELV